ncbi:hypothetical protein ACTXT7_000213 [Hymenolepis weldensis]
MSKKTSSNFKPFTMYDPSQPLSQIYKKRAAKELNEDPAQVSAHLESLKRWIKSMPHLKCTTDDDFLLAFLRQAKFNHMKAQARLDKFCTFRTHPTEGYPEWFKDTPRRREYWEKWLKLKSWTPLGFTQDGVMVAMMKWESFDLCEMTMEDLQCSFQLWTDYCLLDPRAQIGGICMIMDLTGLKKETMMKMFDSKMAKGGTKYFQIMTISDDLTPAYDSVPGLKDIMPQSLGGNNKLTFEQICEKNFDMLKSIPAVGDTFDISVDESKRPKENKYSFGVYKDIPSDIMGKAGNYVKLNDEI